MNVRRSSYRKVHPAVTFLLRACAPGDLTHLRSWKSVIGKKGEKLTIAYDLPDGEARARAAKLVRQAPSLRLTAVGGKAIHELSAVVEGDVLTVSALLRKAS